MIPPPDPETYDLFKWVIGLLVPIIGGWNYMQQNAITEMRQRQDDLRESLRLEAKNDLQNLRAEISELRRESIAGQRDIRDKLDMLLSGRP